LKEKHNICNIFDQKGSKKYLIFFSPFLFVGAAFLFFTQKQAVAFIRLVGSLNSPASWTLTDLLNE